MVLQAMGMAVMLDVIINYVRSLQNQIDVSCLPSNKLQFDAIALYIFQPYYSHPLSASFILSLSFLQFLSMKLSTASLYYDFNSSDMDAVGTMQVCGKL